MISLKHLIAAPGLYRHELTIRHKKPEIVDTICRQYEAWKTATNTLDTLRAQKNEFNTRVMSLSGAEKLESIAQMKSVSSHISELETEQSELKILLDGLVSKIPNLSSALTPPGADDTENVVIKTGGTKPSFSFVPVPYYELAVYKRWVDAQTGAKNMGARGYYLSGSIARFQKALFDWAEEYILQQGFEYMYVPLMLNTATLTGTGHYPDFDGQMYETPIDENKSYYLIGSSEPSMISYYAQKNLEKLEKPILMMANTTCFRKEAGSYGKDQQGILRVHQFEKIEMNAICRPEDNDSVFALHGAINEALFDALGLHWQAVEVCTGDMPAKHYRQIDYEGWFPAAARYRELSSNGSASDYQNRTLGITYTDEKQEKQIAWGLNCTGLTFRTGLAIMEQCQTEDGRVKLPAVIAKKMGMEYLE
jgi:seryl-tRNA synthetase